MACNGGDSRRWTLEGDPPRVHTGPAIYPGLVQTVVPAAELDRLRGVVAVAIEELSRERKDGVWQGSLTELDDLANDAVQALRAALPGERAPA